MTGPGVFTATLQVAGSKTFENWHWSVKQPVTRLIDIFNARPNEPSVPSYNASTAAIQGLIQRALDEGVALRGLGNGWSFTPIAATDGILLNTKLLNHSFQLNDANLDANYQGRGPNLFFAQCGTKIADISTRLLPRGKSLRTSGASNGQTIAGAISTGTHGSAVDGGAIHDSVVALHIITAPDRHVWLERATNPVVSASFVGHLGAQLVRDDALFDAALVSLGSFGMIHGVVLEVDDLFYLQEYRNRFPENAATWAAIEQLNFAQLSLKRPGIRPYFFQTLFNPYDRAGGPHLTYMYRDPTRPAGAHEPVHNDQWRPGDSAAELVAGATDLASGLTKAIAAVLVKQLYPDLADVAGTWGQMFWDTSSRGRSASSAMGIPLNRVRQALDELYTLNAQFQVPGFFAMRFVRGSRATLAFTRHAQTTCVLEIDGANSKRMREFYQAVWARFTALGIPFTCHWGKMFPMTAAFVKQAYGQQRVDAWRAARSTLLPTPALQKVFSNQLVKNLGLA